MDSCVLRARWCAGTGPGRGCLAWLPAEALCQAAAPSKITEANWILVDQAWVLRAWRCMVDQSGAINVEVHRRGSTAYGYGQTGYAQVVAERSRTV